MILQILFVLLTIITSLWATTAQAANPEDVTRLLSTKSCNSCDLSGADLVGVDLTGAQLEGANLNAANLTGADLTGANLTKASLAGSNLVGANLQQSILTETSLVYANLALAQLNNALLNKTDLQAANLTGSDWQGAKVTKSSFIAANIFNLKNSRSLYYQNSRNIFRGEIKIGLSQESSVEEKLIPDTSTTTFESGGTAPARIYRRYRIPRWIGRPLRSTAGATRLHYPENPDLVIDIW